MGKQKVVTVKRRKKFVTFFLAETMIIRKINLFFILLWLAVATESRLAKWNDDVEPDAVDYMPVLQKVLEADAPVAQADDEDIDVEAPMKSTDVRQGQECCTEPSCRSYRGKIATTISGKTCQAWNKQTPHKHTHTTELPFVWLG